MSNAMTPAEAARLAGRGISPARKESNRRASIINDFFFQHRLHTRLHADGTENADEVRITLRQPNGGRMEVPVQPLLFNAWLQGNSSLETIATTLTKKHERENRK